MGEEWQKLQKMLALSRHIEYDHGACTWQWQDEWCSRESLILVKAKKQERLTYKGNCSRGQGGDSLDWAMKLITREFPTSLQKSPLGNARGEKWLRGFACGKWINYRSCLRAHSGWGWTFLVRGLVTPAFELGSGSVSSENLGESLYGASIVFPPKNSIPFKIVIKSGCVNLIIYWIFCFYFKAIH